MNVAKPAISTSHAPVNWLDRSLLVGPHIALVKNKEELSSAVENCGGEPVEWDFETLGCACIHFALPDGSDVCLIAVNPSVIEAHCDPIKAVGVLVHEVVHVYQAHREKMAAAGHKDNGELEAYSIMNLTITVLREYSRLRDLHLSNTMSSMNDSAMTHRPLAATVLPGQSLTAGIETWPLAKTTP